MEMAGVPKINGRTPLFGGAGGGWGFVGPVHAPHPNLQTAWLRFVASRNGQYQYDLTYGGVVGVAWADIFFHDTSRFVPHDDRPTPIPEWKRADWAVDALPQQDPARDPGDREVLGR